MLRKVSLLLYLAGKNIFLLLDFKRKPKNEGSGRIVFVSSMERMQ